jgi:hypothetical protein
MVSSGLLRRVALVRTDVSEERGASFIRVTKIGELGTTQAATSNRCTLLKIIRIPCFWIEADVECVLTHVEGSAKHVHAEVSCDRKHILGSDKEHSQ